MQNTQNADIRPAKLPRYLLKGLITSLIITFAALLLLSVIITYTPLNEAFADTAVAVITYIAIAAGGFSAAKGTRGRGWLTGIISALLYILIMWITSSAVRGNMHIDGGSAVNMLISLLSGAFGGIVGINIRN